MSKQLLPLPKRTNMRSPEPWCGGQKPGEEGSGEAWLICRGPQGKEQGQSQMWAASLALKTVWLAEFLLPDTILPSHFQVQKVNREIGTPIILSDHCFLFLKLEMRFLLPFPSLTHRLTWIFYYYKVKWSEVRVAQSCPTLCDPMDYTVHGILHARILGWAAFPFSRRLFPTQGSNPGLLHCRWLLYQLSHKGSPRILEWVAYPSSSRSSWPRNPTGVSCIAGRFFTKGAVHHNRTQTSCCLHFHHILLPMHQSQIHCSFPLLCLPPLISILLFHYFTLSCMLCESKYSQPGRPFPSPSYPSFTCCDAYLVIPICLQINGPQPWL